MFHTKFNIRFRRLVLLKMRFFEKIFVTIFHMFYMKCVAFVLHEVCSPDKSVFSFIKVVFTYRVLVHRRLCRIFQ